MPHDVYSPVLVDGEWYVECSCGADYTWAKYKDAEDWCDDHSKENDLEDFQASPQAPHCVQITNGSSASNMIVYTITTTSAT